MHAKRTISGWTAALLLTISIVPLSVPAGAAAADVREKVGTGTVNWSHGILTVTGTGVPPERGNAAQKRLMALRAAQVDGYRQIAEVINGVRVDSETVVKDFVVESDEIRTQVSALVKGAQRGEPRYQADGSVEVPVSIPMFGADSLADAIDLEKQGHKHKQTALPVTADLGPAVVLRPLGVASHRSFVLAAGRSYTGVIIDCTSAGAQPAMSPSILDDTNQELYVGSLPVDPDIVVNQGIVGYRPSLAAAQADQGRVGAQPLVLSARQAAGRFHSDAVLSQADSAVLAQANLANPFLAQTKVSFVIQK
jgi:hypothetical protein